ncbi:Protein kinase domain-containing protein [Aphelenchoides fujianensis]|nr:Protein kinase domain-containing protein [Aphelenchoides fujianensis]KAI6228652.1 Protein kinase domain-containing protein [Aphelenchoides fujianensis]
MGNKSGKPKEAGADALKERKVTRNQELKRANKELSCVQPQHRTKRAGDATAEALANPAESQERELQARHELAAHLRSIAPFNRRWAVTETISEGTYGVVFAVRDVKTGTEGVIKVAKSKQSGNQTTEWEGFLLERIFRQMPSASVVRLLDKGMLADQHGQGMEFIVLEKAEIPVQRHLEAAADSRDRRRRVLEVALQMLKGVADMHTLGLLHRDLKPDNTGITRDQQVALLFDLGMARMYTDGEGGLRPPRSVVPFRGTPEWASGHAQKGREQTRFDDLLAWLYVVVELFAPKDTNQPLPWTYRNNSKVQALLKSSFAPARNLLHGCPAAFYTINAYLHTANRQKPPDYAFIADRLKEALEEVRNEPVEQPPPLAPAAPAPAPAPVPVPQ